MILGMSVSIKFSIKNIDLLKLTLGDDLSGNSIWKKKLER